MLCSESILQCIFLNILKKFYHKNLYVIIKVNHNHIIRPFDVCILAMENYLGTIETLHTWNTGFSADSIEWCPIEKYQNIFVCGTYQLTEKDESSNASSVKRLGRLFLFAFDNSKTELVPIQTIETAAILDQKWCQFIINEKPHLGVVNASGFLQIYALCNSDGEIFLNLVTEICVDETLNNLALSLDWSSNKYNNDHRLAVSNSNGKIVVFTYDGSLTMVESWSAHDYEAWICAFDSWNPSVIFTGGDDSKLKVYDRRCIQKPQHVIKHDAGVTSFHSNLGREGILASGGYDQFVQIWDTRNLMKNLQKVDTGGGVWRLKWEPKEFKLLLAACMYGGFALLKYDDTLDILARYDHESIAYGADWCYDSKLLDTRESSICNLIATCSFYNCKLTTAAVKL